MRVNMGDRNSPTVLNAAFHSTQFWDGRAKDVEEQAGGPILNPAEMVVPTEAFLVKRLREVPEYRAVCGSVSRRTTADQLHEYPSVDRCIRTYPLSHPLPLRSLPEGDVNALSAEEKAGLKLYIETGCVQCHAGPMLGGMTEVRHLRRPPSELKGRQGRPGSDAGDERFDRQGCLQSAGLSEHCHDRSVLPHNGSVKDLDEAVRIMGKKYS